MALVAELLYGTTDLPISLPYDPCGGGGDVHGDTDGGAFHASMVGPPRKTLWSAQAP